MAINENPALLNQHVTIIGTSGAGKSQVCKHLVPPRGVRFVAFDPDSDHRVPAGCRFDAFNQFCRALIQADRSGKPFRLAYSGGHSAADFQRFCEVLWDILDGNTLTHIALEEAGDFCASSGPAKNAFGRLLRRSRKYGGIIYTISQRGAELPTTARTQVKFKYVGIVDEDDLKTAAKYAGVTPEQLAEIEPDTLTFYKREANNPPEKVQFSYLA